MRETHWRAILGANSAGDGNLREAILRKRAAGTRLDVRVSWETGDAVRFVEEALGDGVGTIVVAAGDGTLGEVASSLAGRDEAHSELPVLGLVPSGTANDFAGAAGIPTDPPAALELISTTSAVPIDLLRIQSDGGEHWSANLVSGGFVTEATAEAPEGLKKRLGRFAYLLTGLSKLDDIEPVFVSMDGPGFRWEGPLIALGLGNGRQAGGGHVLCPDALLDDGQFDLTVVPKLSGELGAVFGALLAKGKEAALEQAISRSRMQWLRISAPDPLVLNLDGQPVSSRHFDVECVPHRVRMHLPPDCPLLTRNVPRRAPA